MLACNCGMEAVALRLIACGVDVNVVRHNDTALIQACHNDMEAVALGLLDAGADALLGRHWDGSSARALAAANDMAAVVARIDAAAAQSAAVRRGHRDRRSTAAGSRRQ